MYKAFLNCQGDKVYVGSKNNQGAPKRNRQDGQGWLGQKVVCTEQVSKKAPKGTV